MKKTSTKQPLTAFVASCALALGLGSTTASAVFVDYGHSAEGVANSASVPGYRTTESKPAGVFVDHEHSAAGVDPDAAASSKQRSVKQGVFIDGDHTPESVRS